MPAVRTTRTSALEIAYESRGEPDGARHLVARLLRRRVGVGRRRGASGRRRPPRARSVPARVRRHAFLNASAPRMAQQAAIGQDLLEFIDALGLTRAALARYDWGGRAACIASIRAPQRVRALVTIGGYNVQNTLAPPRPASPAEERAYWYQWYFNTERSRAGLEANRRELCRLLWQEWSPSWRFDEAAFERTAGSFDNPDFVDVVIHSYRHRHRNAPGEARFDDIERRLAERPPITVPTIVLHGADDAVEPSRRSEREMSRFLAGAGHFLPGEQPAAVVDTINRLLAQTR